MKSFILGLGIINIDTTQIDGARRDSFITNTKLNIEGKIILVNIQWNNIY